MTMLAILAALGWAVAALLVGLWWGERGRRVSAEHLAATGRLNVATEARRLHRATSTADLVKRAPPGAFVELPAGPVFVRDADPPPAKVPKGLARFLQRRARGQGRFLDEREAIMEAEALMRRAKEQADA